MSLTSEPGNRQLSRVARVGVALLAVVGLFAVTVKYSDGGSEAVQSRLAVAMGVSEDVVAGEGALVKCHYKPAVYQIYGGKKRWIPNPATFNKLFRSWKKIRTISCGQLNKIPTGPAYTNGARLIRCGHYPHIYLQSNGQKLWICDPPSYNQFSFAWNKVVGLSLGKCRSICNGPILCNNLHAAVRSPYYHQLTKMGPACSRNPLPGSLVKCGGPAVYQFLNGRLRWIPNPRTFKQLYGSSGAAKVLTYPPGYCHKCKRGVALSKGASLIKCGKFAHIFLLSNGRKRWICDPSTFRYYNFQWHVVKTLTVDVCKHICNGPTICLSRKSAVRQPYFGQLKKLGKGCRRCEYSTEKGKIEEEDGENVDENENDGNVMNEA